MKDLLTNIIIVLWWIGLMATFVYCMKHYPLQPKGKVCLACGIDVAFHNTCMRKACLMEIRR